MAELIWDAEEMARECLSIESAFFSPVHLSKPYFDEDTRCLLINLSCPTAGLLAGDRVLCDIEVSDQASMVVTTPGATVLISWAGESRKSSKALGSGMVLWNSIRADLASYQLKATLKLSRKG